VKIAVLGTGPSSIQALNTLLTESRIPQDLEVHIFDFNHSAADAYKFKHKSLKKGIEDYSLEVPSALNFQINSENDVWGSFAQGGWSNVWGATLYENNEDYFYRFDPTTLPSALAGFYIGEEKSRRLPNFIKGKRLGGDFSKGNSKKNQQLLPSPLAIRPISDNPEKGCIQCAKCLEGCPYGHIWNANFVLNRFKTMQNIKFTKAFVDTLEIIGNQVRVNLISNSNKSSYVFDIVICGLGAIQTAALLIKSHIVKNSIYIRDSQMITVPFTFKRLKSTGNYDERIALSEATISSAIQFSSIKGDYFSQLYGYSKSLDKVFCESVPLLRLIPPFIRRLFLSRFGIAMIFLSEELSGSIEIRMDGRSVNQISHTNSLQLNSVFKEIQKDFSTHYLTLITGLKKINSVGGGFHFGNIFSNLGTQFDTLTGELAPNSNLLIVDSSALPRISSRPITIQVMRNAERIVRNFMLRMGL
jgi:ferredoxin